MTTDKSLVEPTTTQEASTPPTEPEPVSEDVGVVNATVAALQQLFDREPAAWQEFGQILQEHLQSPLTADSAYTLLNGIGTYIGEETTANALLSALIRGYGDKEFLKLLEDALDDKTRSWVRMILARYGPRLHEMWLIGGENPKSWRTVNRWVSNNILTGWQINFEIIKYNGERLEIQETPSTLLLLATAVLDALMYLPEEQAPNVLESDRLNEFMSKCSEFIERFLPSDSEQTDKEIGTADEVMEQSQP